MANDPRQAEAARAKAAVFAELAAAEDMRLRGVTREKIEAAMAARGRTVRRSIAGPSY